jgi:hypothetical protein
VLQRAAVPTPQGLTYEQFSPSLSPQHVNPSPGHHTPIPDVHHQLERRPCVPLDPIPTAFPIPIGYPIPTFCCPSPGAQDTNDAPNTFCSTQAASWRACPCGCANTSGSVPLPVSFLPTPVQARFIDPALHPAKPTPQHLLRPPPACPPPHTHTHAHPGASCRAFACSCANTRHTTITMPV